MSSTIESAALAPRRTSAELPLWAVIGGLALGFIPLLVFMSVNLWRKEHYQHFPLVIAIVAFLAYVRLPAVQPLGASHPLWRRLLVGLSLSLLALGTVLFSPFVGLIAALVGTLAIAYSVGGRPLLVAWLPLFAALCMIVPLPGGLDEALIGRLQNTVVSLASRVLDVIGVLHVRAGNVLEVPGKRLLVDEACSGINGLQSGLAFITIYCVIMRRPLIVAVPLLLLTGGWVVVVNVFRVAAIGWFDTTFKINLSEGWAHTALGVATFAAVIGLVLSSESLLFFLNSRWARAAEAKPRPLDASAAPAAGAQENIRATWLGTYLGVGAFAALGLLHIGEWGYHWTKAPPSAPEAGKAPRIEMPAQLVGWERRDGAPVERSWAMGVDTQGWAFQKGGLSAVASLDAPHRGFHALEICYRGSGWTVDRVDRFGTGAAGGEVPRSELFLKRNNGRNGLVLYSHLGEDDRWIAPVSDVNWVDQTTQDDYKVRLFRRTHGRIFEPVSYQMQLFIDRASPLTPQELADVRALFTELQKFWREQLVRSKRVIG